MNVLIIHRQESFLQSVQEKFLMGGWRVSTANAGHDGLMMARQQLFDLVLCGVDLPVVSGIELIRLLRVDSVNKNTPMFLVTRDQPGPQEGKLAHQLEAHLVGDEDLLADGVVKFGWLE